MSQNLLKCAQILGHLKTINFSFGTNGKLMIIGVPIFKHFRVHGQMTFDIAWKGLITREVGTKICGPWIVAYSVNKV